MSDIPRVNAAPHTPMLPAIQSRPAFLRAGSHSWPLGRRTYIMGILNVTPDSFSDGGQFATVERAVRHAEAMLAAGADVVDIGGESSRPGSLPVSEEEELQRVMPVLERVCRDLGCPVSIDTVKAKVAEAALAAGACMINDINGLQADPAIAEIARRYDAAVVIMHNARLYRDAQNPDLPIKGLDQDMQEFLRRSCNIALQAGLKAEQLVIDPGVGFGVSAEESVRMITNLGDLRAFNLPILLGPSRKRFIGHILGLPTNERLFGTAAAVAVGIANGADIVRVHDVQAMAEIARVTDAICRGVISEGDSVR